MGEHDRAGWQSVEQIPTLVKGGSLALSEMIDASRKFADRWGASARVTEPLPEPQEPIPGGGLPVNLISGTLAMGGAERHTVELARALTALGYAVTVGVRDIWGAHPGHTARLEAAGVPVEHHTALPEAASTIWWGASLEGLRPPGSIYVVHSASELVRRAIRRCADDIGYLVGVSRMATAVGMGCTDRPGVTVWNGVQMPEEHVRAPRGGPGYVVGYLGRYDTEKGVALALAALAHLPEDVRLRCYGRGPHKGALAQAADEHGVGDRVDVCGVAADLAAVADELDCLIVPDLIQGFPMTVCEALLAGLPVVAVGLHDLPHVLADGRGVAVQPTPRSLAHGVQQAMEMPRADTAWARRHLSAETMAAGYTHVIQEVAG